MENALCEAFELEADQWTTGPWSDYNIHPPWDRMWCATGDESDGTIELLVKERQKLNSGAALGARELKTRVKQIMNWLNKARELEEYDYEQWRQLSKKDIGRLRILYSKAVAATPKVPAPDTTVMKRDIIDVDGKKETEELMWGPWTLMTASQRDDLLMAEEDDNDGSDGSNDHDDDDLVQLPGTRDDTTNTKNTNTSTVSSRKRDADDLQLKDSTKPKKKARVLKPSEIERRKRINGETEEEREKVCLSTFYCIPRKNGISVHSAHRHVSFQHVLQCDGNV